MTPESARTLEALLALTALDSLPRTGWTLRGVGRPESIAGHVLGVAHVALALAPRVESPRAGSPGEDEGRGLDLGAVLAMALVHDAPEALSGDLPRPAARHLPEGAKARMEDALAAEVVAPLSAAAADAWTRYRAQACPESRFVKGCDRLQMGLRWLAYVRAGQGAALDEFRGALAGADFSEFPCLDDLRAEILRGR